MDQLTTDQWTVIVAVVAALIATWQAAIARVAANKQLVLSERIHREQNEPYVIVDIQPDGNHGSLLLIIENTGPTVARDVRISCDPPLESGWEPRPGEPDLTQVMQEILARPIPILPPRRRLTFLLDNQDRFENVQLPRVYTFTVDANGPEGEVETAQYTVDLDALKWVLLEERPTKRVEDKLSKIEKAVHALVPNNRRSAPSRTHAAPVHQRRSSSGDTA
ncbi:MULTISPECIES: hypothetical protein [Streptomyces]|uniref:Secreted protein n=1 Tax=Streptomyces evansiae TaxID=3075535 RepID=A0ABU2R112_9ACTN|nr:MULTISPECIES: hypothetical protein [unclassified Streptomyces]EGJ76290.1 hypothetical protein STTU_3501 [Streptomyces sp. Tu6071]MDT0409385.1 hypothetical protein [Streptomyces sp. DSM 41979]MYQ59725.1 hypothetical protein [Streptomyces sp. SID4926]SCE59272.1 hypothetical protein GA0115252_17601 [Streptomyces sp. DfronAA-171]